MTMKTDHSLLCSEQIPCCCPLKPCQC
uniref:Uncharacterized protein n=1 Tax=Anguilla anguilla TaxID=7936 RepID=A0A0E9SJA8_ANGAN